MSLTHQEGTSAFDCDIIQRFEGGTEQARLAKSRLFRHPTRENSVLVCAGDEAARGALIWDGNSLIQRIDCSNPVLDFAMMSQTHSGAILTALTDRSLKVFKWTAW